MELEQSIFLSTLRAEMFNRITRSPGGCNEWRCIIGKKSRRTEIDKRVQRILNETSEYFSDTDEGQQKCRLYGMPIPQDYTDIVDWIQSAPTTRELSTVIFNHLISKRNRYDLLANNLRKM